MSEILYIKIDRNIVVHKPNVVLADIAGITCTNKSIENKLKTMKVYHFHEPVHAKKGK